MYIPKKFSIAGLEVRVVMNSRLMEEKGCVGVCYYNEQEIHVDPGVLGDDTFYQAFIHEVVHFILFTMGKDFLRKDEEFVDGFAQLAYQILKDYKETSKDGYHRDHYTGKGLLNQD